MKVIAVYGSLKRGKHNYPMIAEGKFLGEATLVSDMYSLGSYPAIVGEGSDEHVVELFEVSDDIHNSVQGMEVGAGYIEKEEEFDVSGKKIKALVYYAGEYLKNHCIKFREKISKY